LPKDNQTYGVTRIKLSTKYHHFNPYSLWLMYAMLEILSIPFLISFLLPSRIFTNQFTIIEKLR